MPTFDSDMAHVAQSLAVASGVLLHIKFTLLVRTHDDLIIGRMELRSNFEDVPIHVSWALHELEWIVLLWNMLRMPQLLCDVKIENEGLLRGRVR